MTLVSCDILGAAGSVALGCLTPSRYVRGLGMGEGDAVGKRRGERVEEGRGGVSGRGEMGGQSAGPENLL